MFQTEANILDRRPERRPSLTNSLSTVTSSAAGNFLEQNENHFVSTNDLDFIPNSNTVNIERVEGYTAIYNIFSTQPNENHFTQQNFQRNRENPDLKPESPLRPEEKKRFKVYTKFIAKRKYWMMGVFCAAIIGCLIWLTAYLLSRNPNDNDTTTTSTIDDITTISSTSQDTSSTQATNEPEFKFFSRSEWGAKNPNKELTSLSLPIRRIIIAHTADDNASCFDSNQCKLRVKKIQEDNLELDDIPYNFLIGGDGSIFEGRGIEFKGQHTSNVNGSSYDEIGICVAFIGTFEIISISTLQTESFSDLIKHFTDEGSITEDHKIFFHDQLAKPAIPADSLLEAVETFKNYYSGKIGIV